MSAVSNQPRVGDFCSRIDPTKEINLENWAVTLICAQKGNHAMLVIEGLDIIHGLFAKRAHLLGPCSIEEVGIDRVADNFSYFGYGKIGRVVVEDKTGKEIRFSGKTETWIRSAEKVQTLLEEAEREEKDNLSNPKAFNIFGRQSVFSKKVTVFKITDEFLQGLYQENPRTLMEVYNTWKGMFEMVKRNDAIIGVLPRVDSARKGFIGTLKNVAAYLCKEYVELVESVHANKTNYTARKCGKKWGDQYEEAFLKIAEEAGMGTVKINPDSCFTWAREKLRLIDIEVGKSWRDFIVSSTKSYVKKEATKDKSDSSTKTEMLGE